MVPTEAVYIFRADRAVDYVDPNVSMFIQEKLDSISRDWKTDDLTRFFGYVASHAFDRTYGRNRVPWVLGRDDIEAANLTPSRLDFESQFISKLPKPIVAVPIRGQRHDYVLYFKGTEDDLKSKLGVLETMVR